MAYRPRLRSSGGCVNCKRRRKKCDEEKPVCGACQHHLVRCIWTSVKQAEVEHNSARDISSDEVTARYFQQRQTVPRGIELSAYKGQVCAAHTLKLYFQGDNMPFDPIDPDRNLSSIQKTLDFAPTHDSVTWDCFVALGLLVFGYRTQDPGLIQAGRLHHVTALSKVRFYVYDEEKRYSLDTLAAVSHLGIISTMIFGYNSNTIDMSESKFHGLGLLIILEKMQPQWFQSPRALAFFEYTRRNLLLMALITQRDTVLTSEAWRTIPWAERDSPKNRSQKLCDLFCDLLTLESEIRLSRQEQNDHGTTNSIPEEVSSLLSRLSEWRRSIDAGLKDRWTTSDQTLDHVHCSRSGLSSWQHQRAEDLIDLATFNLILIYLLSIIIPPAKDAAPQTRGQSNDPVAETRPQTCSDQNKPYLQPTQLAMPIDDPFERAKIAARECFSIWDCAANNEMCSVRIIHLTGPLLVAENFLTCAGEKVAFGPDELLRQMHLPRI